LPQWRGFALLAALLFCPEEGKRLDMGDLESLINLFDYILDTPRKRHITGGILLSISMLFGGLALTVITITSENDGNSSEEEAHNARIFNA
jgi:hypothetical protein